MEWLRRLYRKTVKIASLYTGTFVVVMILNQLLFFGFCLNPVCLIAAMPHVLFITVVVGTWLNKHNSNKEPWVRVLSEWADKNNISETIIPRSESGYYYFDTLNLSGHNIKDLPEEIGYLSDLKYLKIDGCTDLKLPEEIGRLQNLNAMSLNGSKGVILPKQIGYLESLEYLSLSETGLTELPNSVGQLSKLKHLHLNSNAIKFLPTAITNLQNIVTLKLGGNHALKLSEEQHKWLQRLRINGCELDVNPDHFELATTRKSFAFNSFTEASLWAKDNPGSTITRANAGKGYIGLKKEK